ncbi:transglycosylase SLT domain-containing protein [Caldichromatium japonicum]|uniref:Transglycosylase SLT domain-containing protein n=1 Tax=Caldichromatium japonicum TaxID=2699430 RepID=A0A6G7VCH2_9GAMM|nr:transglycosylase SLT domain-containing protein [Caldichromatium japonicum]QIK37487.1 transglycosylase SLT domain-containing protein [Caldichromatium japonicum]
MRLTLVNLLALGLVPLSCLADPQGDFLAAESALKRGDLATFKTLSARLRADPLYPYLRFAELTRDLTQTPDTAIESFLSEHASTPLAGRLRLAYLERLAKARRWADYVRIYRPDDSVERRCLYLRALIETGQAEAAWPQVRTLWLTGRSQPDACETVFARWRSMGRSTEELVWARVGLALASGNRALAQRIGAWLPETERSWFERWLTIDRTPAQLSQADWLNEAHPLRTALLAHGIARLAETDPLQAASLLQRLDQDLRQDPSARERALSAVGQALAELGEPQGLVYWDQVGARPDNLPEQERRLRAALRLGAWAQVAAWVERMPEGEAKRERWRYWQGVAQAALGDPEAARASWSEAAEVRSLWGFLAADRLDQVYPLVSRPLAVPSERIESLKQDAAYQRIQALTALGRDLEVRREWRDLAQRLDPEGLRAAALLAHAGGWHDQAIALLAQAGDWDDLEIRFPLVYGDQVMDLAWQIGIEPDWIEAVIRQESIFAPHLASPAGALGLMQVLPTTAAELATELRLSRPSRWELLDPTRNILLGATYLARLRDRFGHAALATAAYNAGPNRVERWLPDTCMEADQWIATIPYAETRTYVERVLSYRIIYAARLGLETKRLRELLPPVSGRTPAETPRRLSQLSAGRFD